MPLPPPSPSAFRVALRRATHQLIDRPLVFDDPLALRIIGQSDGVREPLRAPTRPSSRALRAYLVARARFAEDAVGRAVRDSIHQYLVFGAGLDTFACRNPYPLLRVIEVDTPATQSWKRAALRQNGIPEPPSLAFASFGWEDGDEQKGSGADSLELALTAAGMDLQQRAIVACMGVLPYLSAAAMVHLLSFAGKLPAGSRLVLDYRLPAASLPPIEQRELASLASRVAAAGEPFQQFFTPPEMAILLERHGFAIEEELTTDAVNRRYFSGRTDGLAVSGDGNRILAALRSPDLQTARPL